ncbi:hypothetical protein [Arenimonas terrae]|uniref:Uncharacterized protein n=1 Tax=Arenimonas terrae TaxID=2546226 RepID=A0A5C4RQK9_9GAMM|nr:hypothetical protein [Arenimonas terrae]TNJ33235.1 hypothetical protein E1B00_13125 [Arenimonas terrae]
MIGFGERKAALLLASLPEETQNALLARLPIEASTSLRAAISAVPAASASTMAAALRLIQERATSPSRPTSVPAPEPDFCWLANEVPAAWFARVCVAFSGPEQNFGAIWLPHGVAGDVDREIKNVARIPAGLTKALRAEVGELNRTRGVR